MRPYYRAESWTDLIDQLYAGSWIESLQRFRSPYVFRGMSRTSFELRSGLLRLAGNSGEARRLEPHLLRSFRKYAQAEAIAGHSIWRWLALAQHHGLPTRMLDWTWSPLVAVHFVTEQIADYDCDGMVVAVDTNRVRAFLPGKLRRVIEKEATGVFSIEMLDAVTTSLKAFDELHQEQFVAFLDPPSLDSRIVNQFAAFSVMNDAGARLDEWLERHPDLYRITVIPAKLKWEVRDKLDQANGAERTLFPGLDGLCRWLTRYYTPGHASPAENRKTKRSRSRKNVD